MTEGQSLLLIFGLLYLSECLWWMPRAGVAAARGIGHRWRVFGPSKNLGNDHSGLVMAFPFPPLGGIVLSQPCPFSLTPTRLVAWVGTAPNPGWRPRQSGASHAWADVRDLRREGRSIHVNGKPVAKLATSIHARRLLAVLERLRRAPDSERAPRIEKLIRFSLNPAAAGRRWRIALRVTRRLRVWCNALFLFLFGVIPAMVWFKGLDRTWPTLLAGLLALMLLTAVEFFFVHRRLHPKASGERWTNTLLACVAPHHAIRLTDTATRAALAAFHPLTVARVLLDDVRFASFAGPVLRDLHFPIPLPERKDGVDILGCHAMTRDAAEDFLASVGIEPAALLRPSKHEDETGPVLHCPRCHERFETKGATCLDCGGLKTVNVSR